MKILQSLILYSDEKVFFYDDLETLINALIAEETSAEESTLIEMIKNYKDLRFLVNDLTAEESPHLVLTTVDDTPLLGAIKKRGFIYGEHVISFRQEYLKHCEKLFHKLGK